MAEELRGQTVRAFALLGAGQLLGKLISVGGTLVLARLLTPGDYGLMATATLITGFVSFFNEIGIGAALVQRRELTTRQIDGCFRLTLPISLALVGVTCLISWSAADFFAMPDLQPVLCALSVPFFLGGLAAVPNALLRRELRFREVAGIEFLTVITTMGTALPLAYAGLGVWSLVSGFVAGQTARTVAYWLAARWWPAGLGSLAEAAGLLRFGITVTLDRVVWYVYSNADYFLVAWMLGKERQGIYFLAFTLASMPTNHLTALAVQVAGPVFARLQADHAALGRTLLHFTRGIAYVTFPMLLGMLAVGQELVVGVLGQKWADAVVPMQLLCVLGLVRSIDPLLAQTLNATGRPHWLLRFSSLCAVVLPIGLAIGAKTGNIAGVAAGWLLVYPPLVLIQLFRVLRTVDVPFHTYLGNLMPILVASSLMSLGVSAAGWGLALTGLPVLGRLAILVPLGVLLYLAGLAVQGPGALSDLRTALGDIGFPIDRFFRLGRAATSEAAEPSPLGN